MIELLKIAAVIVPFIALIVGFEMWASRKIMKSIKQGQEEHLRFIRTARQFRETLKRKGGKP